MDRIIRVLNLIRILLIIILIAVTAFVGIFAANMITCAAMDKHDGITCKKIGIVTYEERYRDEDGQRVDVYDFSDVQNGDIFISLSTHSVGWRHGHAAIVVDAENGIMLEAAIWGSPSNTRRIGHWSSYANAAHLRVSEDAAEKALDTLGIERDTNMTAALQLGELAAEFALKYEDDVMYGLLTGMFEKSPAPEEYDKTQCSHLVWYAYENFGVDIDSNGGWLVTPKDILLSDKLEVLEKYGEILTNR